MTIKSYLWGMRIGAILTLAAWLLVVYNIDPEKSGVAGKLLFYGSLLFFLSAAFILLFTWLRRKASSGEIIFSHLSASFRQGILLSLLAIIILLLQSARVLIWWDGLLVVAGMFLIELYFLNRR